MIASAQISRLIPATVCVTGAAVLLTVASIAGARQSADIEFFEKRIRPILVENCLSCHSSSGNNPSGLILESGVGIRKGGGRGPAIVPGHPEQSLLLKAIGYEDKDLQMPPKGRLPQDQREALHQWIKMGAPWPAEKTAGGGRRTAGSEFNLKARMKHWSWQPLKQPAIPVAGKRKTENVNPIDAFIKSRLNAKGLSLSSPADRRTLIRRVTYDLIGLPPTPEEVEAFVNDRSSNAYENLVDRLLASPHYGERWARHWLDLVRFAETDGHEFDFEKPNAYRYRDYVIRALNSEVPFDQFVREHVAGDLLPNPRVNTAEGINESIQATGFWWLGEGKHSPVDLLVDEAERVDNQIDVFSKAFLGLGIACARCHDHKFDAITTRDFYALSGIIKSSRYQEAMIDLPEPRLKVARELDRIQTEAETIARENLIARALGDGPQVAVTVQLTTPRLLEYLAKHALIDAQNPLHPIAMLATDPALKNPAAFDARRAQILASLTDAQARAAGFANAPELFEDFSSDELPEWRRWGEAFGVRSSRSAFRLAPAQPLSVPPGVVYSARGSDHLHGALRSKTFRITKKRILYRIAGRDARISLIVDNFQRIRDPLWGGLTISPRNADRFGWFSQDVSKHIGHRAYIEIVDSGNGFIAVDQIRFADGPPPSEVNPLVVEVIANRGITTQEALIEYLPEIARMAASRIKVAADPTAAEVLVALANALPKESDSRLEALSARLRETERNLAEPRYAMAIDDGTGEEDRVHVRGSTTNLGENVPRRFLEACGGAAQPLPGPGSGRLQLAERMLQSPLIPRVIVNRLWQHHFGVGIVKTPDDFGFMGARPTHPELLDWLASELINPTTDDRRRTTVMRNPQSAIRNRNPSAVSRQASKPWSLKHIHRLIVTSDTYCQASAIPQSAIRNPQSIDPENKLLHRMPVRRLQAEAIRDAILAVSGRLDRRLYGPSVLPNLTPFMEGRGRPAQSGPLDSDGRRTIYISVRRNFLTPLLLAFDYPVPFSSMGRRTVSNVPAQALTLLNNPFVTQQAQHWAQRTLSDPGTTEERIKGMYVTAYARPPDASELAQAVMFLRAKGDSEPTSWSDLAHVLFNVKEFIFVR